MTCNTSAASVNECPEFPRGNSRVFPRLMHFSRPPLSHLILTFVRLIHSSTPVILNARPRYCYALLSPVLRRLYGCCICPDPLRAKPEFPGLPFRERDSPLPPEATLTRLRVCIKIRKKCICFRENLQDFSPLCNIRVSSMQSSTSSARYNQSVHASM